MRHGAKPAPGPGGRVFYKRKEAAEINTPTLTTERLILRKFAESDIDALYQIHRDPEVNRFLPWFPLTTLAEAETFYKERYERSPEHSYHYAICLKEDNYPIGYVNVDASDSRDFGYGLRREFWRRGIVTEAGRAVIAQLSRDGIPYITATHDVNNPRSGEVMKRLGMTYQYSYEERWQPKGFIVLFRLYQLNLDGNGRRVYAKYWEQSAVRFVETDL